MRSALAWVPALALAAHAGAEPPRLRLELGYERSMGSLGELQAEHLDQLALSLRAERAGWTWGLEVPTLRRRDPDGTAAGLGDVVLRLGRELLPLQQDSWGLDLGFKLKSATGDAVRGLGTGKVDTLLQLEWARVLGGGWLAFGELGYRVTGNPPGRAPLANPWHLELGLQSPWWNDRQFGAFAHGRQAVSRLGPRAEVTVYGQQRWGDQQARLHLTRGNGRGSSDWALGLAWIQRWP